MFHKMHAKSIKPLPVTPNITNLITFIRSTEKLATTGTNPYLDPLGAIAAYAEDAAVAAIATSVTNYDATTWHNTVRRICDLCIKAPGPASKAEAVLLSCPPRKLSQSIDDYYAYFKKILENAIWVRKLYSQDVSNNWAYSFHVQWVLNLNVAPSIGSLLSPLVTPTSTFAEVFNTACQGITPSERAGTAVRLDRLSNIESSSTFQEQHLQDHLNRIEDDYEKIRVGQNDIQASQHDICAKLNAIASGVNRRPKTSLPHNDLHTSFDRGRSRSRSSLHGRSRSRSESM